MVAYYFLFKYILHIITVINCVFQHTLITIINLYSNEIDKYFYLKIFFQNQIKEINLFIKEFFIVTIFNKASLNPQKKNFDYKD